MGQRSSSSHQGDSGRFPGDFGLERLLRLRGVDSLDLLQRISASEFRNRDGGEIFWALFTNAKGRIVDLALASQQGKEELLLLAGEGRGKTLRSWIESFIISEDVQLTEGRDALSPSGPEVDEGARKILEAAQREAEATRQELEAIRSFRFRPGIDLDERFHPLEVGLERLVSWDKGCYIGQEVVARLKNYDKVRRAPAVLRAAPTARGTGELRGEKRVHGELVRAALQSDPAQKIGLAVVDKDIQQGAVLLDEDGAEWQLVGRPEGVS